MAAYEVSNLMVANPNILMDCDPAIFYSTEWDVLNPSPSRLKVDALVADALGFTSGEQDAIYEGVAELIENRNRKAESI